MQAPYVLVDVFARGPLTGNQLAVFPEPGTVEPALMQAIAREMNLSETTFVTAVRDDGYDVRIFTPADELPFAGHPTLGTAWALRERGQMKNDRLVQRSAAGDTPVSIATDMVWFERSGSVGTDTDIDGVARDLGVPADEIGFDASVLGMERVRLGPAMASAGVDQLMVPLSSAETVAALTPQGILDLPIDGVYCFAPLGPGRVKARFFAPAIGIAEDPATGSAAAALGLYLGDRAGELAFEIVQGEELGRPSLLAVDTARGRVRVGGSVVGVAEGTLRLP